MKGRQTVLPLLVLIGIALVAIVHFSSPTANVIREVTGSASPDDGYTPVPPEKYGYSDCTKLSGAACGGECAISEKKVTTPSGSTITYLKTGTCSLTGSICGCKPK